LLSRLDQSQRLVQSILSGNRRLIIAVLGGDATHKWKAGLGSLEESQQHYAIG
jgi:hypothetical protein